MRASEILDKKLTLSRQMNQNSTEHLLIKENEDNLSAVRKKPIAFTPANQEKGERDNIEHNLSLELKVRFFFLFTNLEPKAAGNQRIECLCL